MTKTLAICCMKGILLPSYIGIIISHYKDPYQPTSVNRVFNVAQVLVVRNFGKFSLSVMALNY